MKKELYQTPYTSTMRLQSSSRVEHRKVWGVLFMTYYNPQPIHPDECDLQIADYELKKEYHDYQRQEKFITLPQFKLAVMECDCWIIYYKRCKQLYIKQYEKDNNNI
jgi:hypothetical protein